MEAGCKKKEWEMKDGIQYEYHWNSTGELLSTRVCINDDYQKQFPPQDGTKKVYCTIETHEVRDVDARKKTLSIDFTITMRWLDSRIKVKFTNEEKERGEVLLGPTAIDKIWSPDLHILNRQSFKFKEEWASLVTTRILTTKTVNHLDGKNKNAYELSIPTVEMKYEVKTAIYCKDWSYAHYPMDHQKCNVSIGSASASSVFTMYNESDNYSCLSNYTAVNFNITTECLDQGKTKESNRVVIKIMMRRLEMAYLLKYYAPCAAIVLVSEIGFLIPVTAIPGRVSLLVTQFLTLINLFIHQMVSFLSTTWRFLGFRLKVD